jgi:putative ABC transport system permease protein
MQDFPGTSHIQYDFFLSMSGYQLWKVNKQTGGASNYPTYVLLKAGANAAQLQAKLGAHPHKILPAFS